MANRTRKYRVQFTWKDEGNRAERQEVNVEATTVQRAISKVVKNINEGLVDQSVLDSIPEAYGDDDLRTSDLLVIDVRTETK